MKFIFALLIICTIKSIQTAQVITWFNQLTQSSAFATQGWREYMEDRYHMEENLNGTTNISIFAIFDGHGGDQVANYALNVIIKNLRKKILEIHQLKSKNESLNHTNCAELNETKENSTEFKTYEAFCYLNDNKINYNQLLTDELQAADNKMVQMLRDFGLNAGSTALIAIVDNSRLVVANVGDSRGVLCDHSGATIPLSFDHKPNDEKEKKRIEEAGGFIKMDGVWRVNGDLAVSRALGDSYLKPNFVIAKPDVLEFDLNDLKPQFMVLGSDGLWDTYTNEQAVEFIKENINGTDLGAKNLTITSLQRGSSDNISVIIVAFKDGKLEFKTTSA